MITSFSVFAPPMMGYGASAAIGEKCKSMGIGKVILVYDEGIRKVGLHDGVEKSLAAAGVEFVVYDRVVPDPTDTCIEDGARFAQAAGGVQAVIGLGGGSSLDTAKGINVLMGNPFPLSDYFLGGKPTQKGLPLFLIPTTAGTGSECTMSCIVTDTKNNRKTTIRSLNCNVAAVAIVDPGLTLGVPPQLTALTGIDAFCHAAESLTVKNTNPMSDTLDKESLRRLHKSLPVAVRDGKNREARESVALASMMAGMAFANSLCHLGHCFGHAMGATLHIPHGVCVGAAIAQVVDFVSDVIPEKVKTLGECLGVDFPASVSSAEIGRKTGEAILAFKREINLPTLEDMKVDRDKVIASYPLVRKDGCYPFTAKEISEEQVKDYLGKMYDNTL